MGWFKFLFISVILFLSWANPRAASSQQAPESAAVRIGALLPMTGDYAQYGRELWRGLELASIEIQQGGQEIKLFLEDGATMAANASLSAAMKLVKLDQVRLLVVLGADDVGPLIGLSHQSNTPILSLWDNSDALMALGDLVFSSGFKVEATGSRVAEYVTKKLQLRRAAIISNHTTWSTSVTDAFKSTFKERGGEVVFHKQTEDTWTDFRALIPQLQRMKPDVLYLPLSLPSSVEACIRQLRQGGVTAPIFTGEAAVGESLERLGVYSEGIYVGWLPGAETGLVDLYRQRYHEDSADIRIVQVGFRGLMEVAKAIRGKRSQMKDGLTRHFGTTRAVNTELVLYRVREARLEALN
jgi:ABC-type branched-subunit amino acid transport system substrate-binding protein